MAHLVPEPDKAFSGAWRLAAPFFTQGPQRRSACAALAATLLLNLSVVGLGVVMSYWRNQWYSALQARDWPRFLHLLVYPYVTGPDGFMPGFVPMACLMIGLSIQAIWLRQWLQIGWRTAMTERLLAAWRATPAERGIDNPDQRIADDIRYFTEDALLLGLDVVTASATAIGYIVVLWRLSGTVTIAGLAVPGSMVFAAILYAAIGSWLTHLVGRRLAWLDGRQQRKEADFRFRLALHRPDVTGDPDAAPGPMLGFGEVAENFRAIMNLSRLVRLLTRSYNQVADIFPLLVAAPRYFAGAITLGTLLQIGDSFAQVQDALSWFVNNYAALADLSATVRRLDAFCRAVER